MKVGVLGTGVAGRALGTGFAVRGHEVMMGSRSASNQRAAEWAEAGDNMSTGTFADAAAFAELAVLATAWPGTENALSLAGAGNLAGKVLIDATNPLAVSEGNPLPGLALGHTDSGGEQVQRWVPDARVVKAFNIVGHGDMVDPQFPGGPPDMFFCGNDDTAKATVKSILADFGWEPVDIGGIEGARLLEPLCILWVVYGARTGTWDHAFKLLRR